MTWPDTGTQESVPTWVAYEPKCVAPVCKWTDKWSSTGVGPRRWGGYICFQIVRKVKGTPDTPITQVAAKHGSQSFTFATSAP